MKNDVDISDLTRSFVSLAETGASYLLNPKRYHMLYKDKDKDRMEITLRRARTYYDVLTNGNSSS